MCSRHAPTNGADSEREWANPFDSTCDMCGRTVWDGSLRPEHMAGSTLWKCAVCRARDQQRYEEEVAS